MNAIIQSIRPKQWAKNLLVIGAPLAAGVLDDAEAQWDTFMAFGAFCAIASATYLLNDLRDEQADRLHPTKHLRPIAAGTLARASAVRLAVILVLIGVLFGLSTGEWAMLVVLGAYAVTTVTYSVWIKRVVGLELIVLAAGFMLRAIGGAVAVNVGVSPWFLGTTGAASLFVVTGKRFAELNELGTDAGSHRRVLTAYSRSALQMVLTISILVTAFTYGLWAIETSTGSQDENWWGEVSVLPVLMGLFRYQSLLHHGEGAAPEEVFWRDRPLQILGAVWAITFIGGVYGV